MVIPLHPHQLPAKTAKLVESNGTPSRILHQFMRTLFDRTGGASGLINKAGANLTAAGSTQNDATLLTDDYSEILNGSGGVVMRALQPGQQHRVFNGLTGNLNVYPPPGGKINNLAIDAPYVLAAGTSQQFWASSVMSNGGTQYRSITLG